MILDKNYYFSNYEKNEIMNEIFSSIENVLDLYNKSHQYINMRIVENDIKENNAEVLGNITINGNYLIGQGTKIYPGVTIEGPVIIGENCKIMPGAYVRPGCIIGNNCVIGFNSEVKNSIIQDGAKIASLAFVGDSILGKSARIGSGVITANRRFDQKNITIKLANGEKIDSNTDFFGCIMGDYSRFGANSVSVPGSLIGQYSWIFPLTTVRGFVPSEKRVYNRAELVIEDNEKMDLK